MRKLALLVLVLSVVPYAEALAAAAVPLELVDKRVEDQIRDYDDYRIVDQDGKVRTLTRDEVPARTVEHFTLLNTSQKVVDAWSFTCLHALADGHFALASTSSDGYLLPERGRGLVEAGDGLIYPGDTIEITRRRRPDAGKYYAVQCRVDVVVFTDRTWAGEENEARGFFDKRLKHAVDARNALAWAQELLQENGTSKAGLAGTVEAWLQRLEEQESSYASPVRQALEWRRSSTDPDGQDLLSFFSGYTKSVQEDLEQILGRLPEEWQAAFYEKAEASR